MNLSRFHVTLDLDDFAQDTESNAMNWLIHLKNKNKDFKVTLFTILGRWRREALREIAQFDWIQLAAHGYKHFTNDEAYNWDKKQWYSVLNEYEKVGIFEKGFKAPNWEMSPLGYEVLKDMGWWVAVRKHQISDVPKGMQYYCFETNIFGLHGHTWTMQAHKEEGLLNWSPSATFDFVSDRLETK